MPTNLHALIRYRTIDRCLRDRTQMWTWSNLAEECEAALHEDMGMDRKLSRRTIMYDLNHMKSGVLGYHAPIIFDKEEKSYRYEDPEFSINSVPLTAGTLKELDQALLVLRQFSGQEKIEGIGNVIAKLEHMLNIQREDGAEPVIQFEQSLNAPGQKWLNVLYDHIKQNNCLTISYTPFGKEIQHYTVSPYLLKEYNNRWFLFCYNHKAKAIQNIALDRISEIKPSFNKYRTSKEFDPDVYFNNIVGVSIPPEEQLTTIVLEVYGKQANYLKTKPLHVSQKIKKEKKNRTVFTYKVVPNYELESRILSYGEHIHVLKPESLRKRIAKRLKGAVKRY